MKEHKNLYEELKRMDEDMIHLESGLLLNEMNSILEGNGICKVLSGTFAEGKKVHVSISGKEYERMVVWDCSVNDLCITICGIKYYYSDFY